MESCFGAFLAIIAIALFIPKKKKKPKLTLIRGKKYDPTIRYD